MADRNRYKRLDIPFAVSLFHSDEGVRNIIRGVDIASPMELTPPLRAIVQNSHEVDDLFARWAQKHPGAGMAAQRAGYCPWAKGLVKDELNPQRAK